MKKILFGLAALSAIAFGADSTGVHNSTYGNNKIDVETRAFIINSGLVITASAGTENDTIADAIKKAVLDHGTLMAGTNAISEVARTVYVRKTNGTNFPEGTVVNIALNADGSNQNNLKNTSGETDNHKIAHQLDASVTNVTYDAGSGNSTNGNQTLSLSSTDKILSAGDFKVTTETHNIPIELKSTIANGGITASHAEGQYTNTSTLAVRFSKIPHTVGSNDGNNSTLADYTPDAGKPSTSTGGTETPGVSAEPTKASTLAKR